MDAAFWQQRWAENRIGFHQPQVNALLQRWWPVLALPETAPVLVPLCGKSYDLLWLHAAGHPVLGIELSEIAVTAFYEDNGLLFDRHAQGEGLRFIGTGRARGLDIHCGDLFRLDPADCASIRAFYDRAALIAMPVSMQARYVRQLARLLPLESLGLVLTINYDTSRMQGPPFALSNARTSRLLDACFDCDVLEHLSGPERVGNLKERGLDTLDEWVYRVRRRA